MSEKVTVVIPAHNEEGHIEAVLLPLKQWQKQGPERHLVVVNDGSTDKTVEIARKAGVHVIDSHPKGENLGKGEAVKAGALHAKKNGSEIVVTLDADLKGLKPKAVNQLIKGLGGHHMAIAPSEEVYNYSKEFSGQRAIRLKALEPWFNNNPKWKKMLQGYGLESGLNYCIRNSRILENPVFQAHKAFRKTGDGDRQMEEYGETRKHIMARQSAARMIQALRIAGLRERAREHLERFKKRHGYPGRRKKK